jgi:hypothetical protein
MPHVLNFKNQCKNKLTDNVHIMLTALQILFTLPLPVAASDKNFFQAEVHKRHVFILQWHSRD